MNTGLDPSMTLLAASGGDTVKLFDVSDKSADPLVLSYTPSPGSHVNSLKWNHTNMVVASAGDDKKISLWNKNGKSMGTIPVAGTDSGDGIEESILALSFGNKVSRYICSGGTGQVVRIWDLQRKRCIKWLRGHSSTITGAMYNCKDEHLASISLNGNLILHNLASGTRTTELKDPNQQVLRVLDYSRISRHLLVTAGDDGSVHLWDTTARSPKVSWLKQHSAPAAGISFSPSNDKMIATVGLDKKLYTYDSGSRQPSHCISYKAPFSSLAFRDDGWVLAAGTSSGDVVFYDVRGKPEPFTGIRAYSSSEAVTSLCWQRSKPVVVNESNCTVETALLGDAVEDSILMPDQLPSVTSSSLPPSMAVSSSRNPGRSSSSIETSAAGNGLTSSTLCVSTTEDTPQRDHLWPGRTLRRLHPPRSTYNFKDDMEVFSPLVHVHPITPTLDKLWDDDKSKKDNLFPDKKPSSLLFPSSGGRFSFAEDGATDHPIFDWKTSSTSKQDDIKSSFALLESTPAPSSKSENSSITPPEAWGGERFSDKFRQPTSFLSRVGTSAQTSGSTLSGLPDMSLTENLQSLRTRGLSSIQETSFGYPEHISSSAMPMSPGNKGLLGQPNLDAPMSLTFSRRFSTYAERISTTSNFNDRTSLAVSSPKTKKTGAEGREELLNSFLSKSDASTAAELGALPAINVWVADLLDKSSSLGGSLHLQNAPQQDAQQGSSFTFQIFQRTLEETLDSFQKSIHEDMRNLHIEILRQFHMQEMEMSNVMRAMLENQAELMKEVKSLRKENQQLRQLL